MFHAYSCVKLFTINENNYNKLSIKFNTVIIVLEIKADVKMDSVKARLLEEEIKVNGWHRTREVANQIEANFKETNKMTKMNRSDEMRI